MAYLNLETGYTAAFAFFEALWEAGVQYVFANLGTDHPAILEAMVRGQNLRKDQWPTVITCPNEMVALSMADGYARLTGKPQCVIVHVDVGTQGLAAAVHNASCGRAPVLIFAGLSPYTLEGEMRGSRTEYIHWIQDVPDQKQIISQYCRYTGEIKTGKNVKQVVNRALQWAMSDPKGPAYLVGAREVMEEEIEPYKLDQRKWVPVTGAALPANAVELIANELVNAKEPLVIVGYNGRDAESVNALVTLANTVKGLRVLDTAGSEMSFPANHPAWLGLRFGNHEAVNTADFILVVDCDVPWIPTVCKPKDSTKVIHLDVDPLKRQIPMFYLWSIATYKVDSTTAFKQIKEYITSNTTLTQTLNGDEANARQKRVEEGYRQNLKAIADSAIVPAGGDDAYLNGNYLMAQLRKAAPEDTIWAIEAVTLTVAVADQLQCSLPNSWINCGGGGLGWSGGGALGIKLATDDQHGGKNKGKFVCQIVGDGTYLFCIPGSVYWIARRYNIPILTIVINNKGWNAPRRSLLLVHPDGEGSKVSNEDLNISFVPSPDYPGIAKAAAGGQLWAGRASTVKELSEQLPRAIQSVLSGTSAVLEAQLDGTDGKYVEGK
ncbi:putative thiamine pyrophosphate enzyme [Talaromyces proteolyticus]|uniref:Thiamine pyrophosphate enzyme n=1 Tax=Talaromyces proteolyticus TaxID=1131652 RepID=A0AAD4Q3M7_9EURO|nr:putative thiamine pyrophosphate enzyme [Talaromyces proteolyticus]KAH8705204.1 putative thiamine pyrophosphate enzyme [Talaromyces proteolyticus]